MAAKIRRTNEFLPLSPPVLYILLAISDGARHGYAIMQEVERRTSGAVRLLPGSLYSTIKRMLTQGLIESSEDAAADSADPRRRYYAMTAFGRDVAEAEMRRMATLIDFAKQKHLVTEKALRVRS